MKYHPIFIIDGKWHVEITGADGKQSFVPFENYSSAFDFYRQSYKIIA